MSLLPSTMLGTGSSGFSNMSSISCNCEVDFVNKMLPYPDQKISISLQPCSPIATGVSNSSKDVPSSSGSGGKLSSVSKASMSNNKVKVLKLTIEDVSIATMVNTSLLLKDLMQTCGFIATASYCEKCYQPLLEQDSADANPQGYFGGLVNSSSSSANKTSNSNKISSNSSKQPLQKVKGFAMFVKHLHAIDGFALCSVITCASSASSSVASKSSPNTASSSSTSTTKTAKRLKPTLLRQGILLPMGANRAVIYLEDENNSTLTSSSSSAFTSKHSYNNLWKKYYSEPRRNKRNPFVRLESRGNAAVISELENSNSMMAFERNSGSNKLSRGLVALNKVGPTTGTTLSRSKSTRRESIELMKEALLSDEKSNHERTLNEMFYSDESDIQSIGSYHMLRTQSRLSNASDMSEDIGEDVTMSNSQEVSMSAIDNDNGIAMLNETSNLSATSDKQPQQSKSGSILQLSSPATTEDGSNLFPALREEQSRFSQHYSPLHDDSPMDYSSFNKEDTLNFYVSATGFGDDEESKMYIDGNNYIVLPTGGNHQSAGNNHNNRSPTPNPSSSCFSYNAAADDSSVRMVDAPNSIKVTSNTTSSTADKPRGLFDRVLGGAGVVAVSTGISNLISFFSSAPSSQSKEEESHDEESDDHKPASKEMETEGHRQSLLSSLIESTNSSAENSKAGQTWNSKQQPPNENIDDGIVEDDEDDNRTESTLAEQDYLLDIQQSLAMDNLLYPVVTATATPSSQQHNKTGKDKKRSTSVSSIDSADSTNNANNSNQATRNKSTPSPLPSSNSNTPQVVYQAGKEKVSHLLNIIQEHVGESSPLYLPLEQLLAAFEHSPYVLSKTVVDMLLVLPSTEKKKASKNKDKSASSNIEAALALRKKKIGKFLLCMKLLLKQKIGSDRHTVKAFCCIAMMAVFVVIEIHQSNRSFVKVKELESQIVNAMMRLNLALGSPAIPAADMSYLFSLGSKQISSTGSATGTGARIELMVGMMKKLYSEIPLWSDVISPIIDEYDYAKKIDNPSPIKVAPTQAISSNMSSAVGSQLNDILAADLPIPAVDPPSFAMRDTSSLMPPPPPVNMNQSDIPMPDPAPTLKRSNSITSINSSNATGGISRQNSLISERKPILGHRQSMSKSRAITVNPLLSAYNMKVAKTNSMSTMPTYSYATASGFNNAKPNSTAGIASNRSNAAQNKAVVDRFRSNFPENSRAKTSTNQHSPLSPSPKKARKSFSDHEFSSPLPSTPMRLDPTYSQVDVVESTPMDVYYRSSQEGRSNHLGHASAIRGQSARKSTSQSIHDIFPGPSSSSRKINNSLASPSMPVGRSILNYHDEDDHLLGTSQDDDTSNDFEILRKNTRGMRTASAAAYASLPSFSSLSPALDIAATSTPIRSRKKRDLSEILDIGDSVIHHDLHTGDSSDVTDVASYQNSAQSHLLTSSVDTEGRNSTTNSATNSVDKANVNQDRKSLRRSSRTKSLREDSEGHDEGLSKSGTTHKSPINTSASLFE